MKETHSRNVNVVGFYQLFEVKLFLFPLNQPGYVYTLSPFLFPHITTGLSTRGLLSLSPPLSSSRSILRSFSLLLIPSSSSCSIRLRGNDTHRGS